MKTCIFKRDSRVAPLIFQTARVPSLTLHPHSSLMGFPMVLQDDVCIETSEGRKHCKLIAVYAGLEKTKGVPEQLIKLLRTRDTSQPKIVALTGRSNVLDIPQELVDCPTPIVVVSGHHGKLELNGLRLIIDESGGQENKPLAAIVFPSMMVVRDIGDDITSQP
ncbi:PREDICTED: uncharacterized protein LOC104587896 isoform X2 [Nelumbo nucifera]|uniref:Uncharacterized protein LOC104587896 isoform X2 n=1 Tax=Nelumbo nucifera TaxID=4432 RepID=A0A1U8PYL3_NELNU|nr:PREDICTED: uncharacterized protein LOC104587896 isoform X2 [Nelumbo nucifera]